MSATIGVRLPAASVGAAAAPDPLGHAAVLDRVRQLERERPAANTSRAMAVAAIGGAMATSGIALRAMPTIARVGLGLAGVALAGTGAMMLFMPDDTPARASRTPSREPRPAPTKPLEFNQERREGPTPNGGAYSIASYFDATGEPVRKQEAATVRIVEYSADGAHVHETSASIGAR